MIPQALSYEWVPENAYLFSKPKQKLCTLKITVPWVRKYLQFYAENFYLSKPVNSSCSFRITETYHPLLTKHIYKPLYYTLLDANQAMIYMCICYTCSILP